ncbi:biotin transporter BioY [Neogemmobacter tilapiae]|jgi:biotin transport system substrate-specific component|uniref:Biotin transporter n=1 Tax=Neogemmobacter tilapiae TaxID=875041 RepID=A0A918TN44_9RHOB|nr:biotin transporter BioY [Gemmobacter tilapiae]GHC49430.1 BioY family transporter [Gemmobacter tilapiae]
MEKNIAYVALFAALVVALGTTPALTLPGGIPPITAQTFGILLCGTVLGARLGGLAVLVFLGIVALGFQVLPGGRGGLGVFVGGSAGFLVGFPVAAFVAGLVMRASTLPVWLAAAVAGVIGGIGALYPLGILGMSIALEKPMIEAAVACIAYLPGDLIKIALCAAVTHSIAQMRPQALLSRA